MCIHMRNKVMHERINFYLVLVVTSCIEKFKGFKKEYKIIFILFEAQYIPIDYYQWNEKIEFRCSGVYRNLKH